MTACCSRFLWLLGLLSSSAAWQFNVTINGAKPRYCVPWPSHGHSGDNSGTAPRVESCNVEACGLEQVRTRRNVTLPESSLDHAIACQRCECRACKQCLCADQLGRLMSDSICWRDRMYREDVVLGSFSTDTECRAACNNYVDVYRGFDPETCRPPYEGPKACHVRLNQTSLRTCNSYSFGRRLCIGHVGAEMYSQEYVRQLDPAREHGKPRIAKDDRVVHGMATCAPQSRQPKKNAPPPQRFVALHTVGSFAVNKITLMRFSRAQASFARTSHLYYALQMGQGEEESDSNATAALTAALGAGTVAYIGPKQVHRAFPKLVGQMSKMTWKDTRKPAWLSNGCDLPGLIWFSLNHASLPKEVVHVWTIQHDIGWTGSLAPILQLFNPAVDLLCDGITLVTDSDWIHADEHNHPSSMLRAQCLLPITRISTRLMHEQVVGIGAGRVSYCELRAATACVNADWPCQAADLRGTGALGLYSHFTSIDEGALISASSKDGHGCDKHVWKGVSAGRLFHRVYRDDPDQLWLTALHRDCPMACAGPNLLARPGKPRPFQQCYQGPGLQRPYISTTRCKSFHDGRRCCDASNDADRDASLALVMDAERDDLPKLRGRAAYEPTSVVALLIFLLVLLAVVLRQRHARGPLRDALQEWCPAPSVLSNKNKG